MLNTVKKALSLVMALLIVSTIALVAPQAMAAAPGTLMSNPITLSTGVYYTKYWTHSNYKLNCFNKIVVPSKGYITITIEKPFDSEGELASFDLYLFKEDGSIAWVTNTSAQRDSFSDSYVYKVGLNAGTYYLNLDPNFYIYSDSAPIDHRYKYDFTADNYWEAEPNNSKTDATVLALDTMYTAVYMEESTDTTYSDYFAVNLTAGKEYRIKIDNFAVLDAGTTIEKFIDVSGEEDSLYNGKEDGTVHYWDITASATGTYYIKLYNECNESGAEYKIGVYELKHVSDAGTVTDEPTSREEGEMTYKCTICGKVLRTEPIPKVSLKPENLRIVKATAKDVVIAWDPAEGATEYLVYWRTDGDWVYFENTTSTQTKISVKGISYKFEVKVEGQDFPYSESSDTIVVSSKPSKISVQTLKPAAKKLTVIWQKAAGADGYELMTATNKKFNKNKKVTTIKKGNKIKVTVKKLKSKKKYFVKVRAYKNLNGKKLYGAWSKVKSVKIK